VRIARTTLDENNIPGEVIVSDNGSTDGSAELAEKAGARVIHEPRRGYGSAYLAGFAAARGEYIVMGDADLTYDFREIPNYVARLDKGAQLVMGNRLGNIEPGAMPWMHQYVGNPIMTRLVNLFFRTNYDDVWCGMRGFRRDILPILDLRATGMEFALEMIIRASKENLVIDQFPITLSHRGGESKLSRYRDGWRGLRFMLVHSPRWLFIIPGTILTVLGAIVMLIVLTQVSIFGHTWNVHTAIAGSLGMVAGIQIVSMGLFARAYAVHVLGEKDPWFDRWRKRASLEGGLIVGGLILLAGLIMCAIVFGIWVDRGFGEIFIENFSVFAATTVIVGLQVVFGSFLLSILALRSVRPEPAA
jgi:glycosyltransferase involved in cell wall biosynthesis